MSPMDDKNKTVLIEVFISHPKSKQPSDISTTQSSSSSSLVHVHVPSLSSYSSTTRNLPVSSSSTQAVNERGIMISLFDSLRGNDHWGNKKKKKKKKKRQRLVVVDGNKQNLFRFFFLFFSFFFFLFFCTYDIVSNPKSSEAPSQNVHTQVPTQEIYLIRVLNPYLDNTFRWFKRLAPLTL